MSKKFIQVNKLQYEIPTSWHDLTIEDQIRVTEYSQKEKYVKTLAIMAGYSNIPMDELKKLPFHRVTKAMEAFKFLNDPIPKCEFKEFEWEGKTYKIQSDIFDMNTEDSVHCLMASENHKDNPAEAYPEILAVLYRADDEPTLASFDLDAKAKSFRKLPFVLGYNIYGFFLQSGNVLNLTSQIFSPEVARQLVQEKNNELMLSMKRLAQDGHGNWFTRLRIGLMIRYLKSIPNRLDTYFSSPASEHTIPRWKRMFIKLGWKKKKRNLN